MNRLSVIFAISLSVFAGPSLCPIVYANPSSGSGTSSSSSAQQGVTSTSAKQVDLQAVTRGLTVLNNLTSNMASATSGQGAVTLFSQAAGIPTSGNVTAGTAPSGNTPSGNTPSGNTPSGNTPSGNATSGNTPPPPAPTSMSTSVYYQVHNGQLYEYDVTSSSTYSIGPPGPFMKTGVTYYANDNDYYVLKGNSFTYVGHFENPYRLMDLRLPTPLSAADLSDYLKANNPQSPLVSLVPVFLEAQSRYGVNAQYLVAHAIVESTWGESQIAHDKNNLFGYSAFDSSPYASATTFPSKAYAILYQAWFVRNYYLDPGGPYYHGSNLDGMNVDYATDPNWAQKIAAVMWSISAYQPSFYRSHTVLPTDSAEPIFSYPSGVRGITTVGGLNERRGPGLNYAVVSQANDHATLNLTGWVPGWYQIQGNGATLYVSSQFAKPTNLGEVLVSDLNFRTKPSLTSPIIGTLSYGEQVELLGGGDNKQWDHVLSMDNVTGYVYGSYISPLE